MRETTSRNETGMSWSEESNLEDLDLVDDLCTHLNQLRRSTDKTTTAEETGQNIGLEIKDV